MKMDEVHKQIKKYRAKVRLKQEEVAEAIGVSIRHYIRIEHGEREPTFEQVKALAATFSISLEELLQAESKASIDENQLKVMIKNILMETKGEVLKPNIDELRMQAIELIKTTRQDDLIEVLEFIKKLRKKGGTQQSNI